MISGKPVKSSIARTSRPASLSAAAVPPVETISTPSSASPRAKSTIPRLSETDSRARWMRTAPGAVDAADEVSEAMRRMLLGAGRGVGCARGGKSSIMRETGPTADPAARLEREADRLEHHLDQLDDHIQEA